MAHRRQTLLALTVWQPWASLIAAGAKPYEWRGWEAPRRLIGQRIAIHAGARKVKLAEIEGIRFLTELSDGTSSLVAEKARPLLEKWHTSPGMLPLSSVLCTATLGKPITAAAYLKQHGARAWVRDSDRIDHSKWAWPLTDIRVLEPFVPAKGAQGFWSWSHAG
jgi:hypothetical protein